jgi:hypothetical protein
MTLHTIQPRDEQGREMSDKTVPTYSGLLIRTPITDKIRPCNQGREMSDKTRNR